MIASMTGFGRGTAEAGGTTATVEMRSVNNRFCEVSVRMPRGLAEHETTLQARVKDAFARGRISVTVQVEQAADDLPLRVDASAARGYRQLLETLRDAAGLDEPVRLAHLLHFTDLLQPVEAGDKVPDAWPVVEAALSEAISALRAMRLQEGAALDKDLKARVDAIGASTQAVEARAPERLAEAKARLHERLAELLGDEHLDPGRLEQEVVFLADKLDVTEETVRLRSHLHLFREALGSDEAVGRKLNFLVQEMGREVNTIGSKANDADLAHLAVGMKEELEKIREQVQNVE